MNRFQVASITLLCLPLLAGAQSGSTDFITLWDTRNPQSSVVVNAAPAPGRDANTIYFPGIGSNYTIRYRAVNEAVWHDLNGVSSTPENPLRVELPAPGKYYIAVAPTGFHGFRMGTWDEGLNLFSYHGDAERLIGVISWGAVQWKYLDFAFAYCKHLTQLPLKHDAEFPDAIKAPRLATTSLGWMFYGCAALTEMGEEGKSWDLAGWDVARVTSLAGAFKGCERLVGHGLHSWDVRSIQNFWGAFEGCTDFQKNLTAAEDISSWKTPSATNMASMFMGCTHLKADLSGWDVAKVTDLTLAFSGCGEFNADLSRWNVGRVTSFAGTFARCHEFRADLSGWDVSSAVDLAGMFFGCEKFNCNLGLWNVEKVRRMDRLFYGCKAFNYPLGNWKPKSLLNAEGMLDGCTEMFPIFYDHLLHEWAEMEDIQPNVTLTARGVKRTPRGTTGLEDLEDNDGWRIVDGGEVYNGSDYTYTPLTKMRWEPSTLTLPAGYRGHISKLPGIALHFENSLNITYAVTTYSSSAPSVARVTPDGSLATLREGVATITAVDLERKSSASFTLIVQESGSTKVTVTFDTQGGSPVEGKLIHPGERVSRPAPDPTKEGHDFVNWMTTPNGDIPFDFNEPIRVSTTIYAKWRARTFTVTLFPDPDNQENKTEQQIAYGERVQRPTPAPVKEGKTFIGWFVPSAGAPYDFNQPVKEDFTLFAKFEQAHYAITIVPDNGQNEYTETVAHGDRLRRPAPDPVRDGYTFLGWYKDGVVYDFNSTVTGPFTLKAVWQKNGQPAPAKFTVTFDPANGRATFTQEVVAGNRVARVAAPTKADHSFIGWYRAGATEPYNFDSPVTESFTLTARYRDERIAALNSCLLQGVEVMPNPVNAELHLVHAQSLRRYTLFNALGLPVLMGEHDGGETITLQVSALPTGVYFIRLEATDGRRTLRVVKQ